MKHYRVAERFVRIGAGERVRMSEDMASIRAHRSEATKEKGVYVLKEGLEFKKGEILGLEDMPRHLSAGALVPVTAEGTPIAPASPAAPKAPAKKASAKKAPAKKARAKKPRTRRKPAPAKKPAAPKKPAASKPPAAETKPKQPSIFGRLSGRSK